MPIYEYVCEDCSTRHERLVLSSAANGNHGPTCPKCGSERQAVQFSVFAAPGNANGVAASGTNTSSGGSCGCTPRTCGCH